MNRAGQVWLEHPLDLFHNRVGEGSVFAVISGPHYTNAFSGTATYMMLDLVHGELCNWSVHPNWETDPCLTRVL
jgi:hypothetical protein